MAEGRHGWNRTLESNHGVHSRLHATIAIPRATSEMEDSIESCPVRPARGVDGIDVADLKHLPDNITSNLLNFLAQINGAEKPWPAQLLYGTVISLAKQDEAHLPNHFRPVVILETVYRTWSRMNALLLLRIFGQIVPSYAHGFLPGRECAQVWLQLQGFIEVCLQQGIEFLDLALTSRNISTTWDATP